MGLSGRDKIYGIKDGHLADEKTVIRILDAGLQKGSSKFSGQLQHLKPERAMSKGCVLRP